MRPKFYREGIENAAEMALPITEVTGGGFTSQPAAEIWKVKLHPLFYDFSHTLVGAISQPFHVFLC